MTPVKWGIIGPGTIARQFARDLAFLPAPQFIQAVLGNHADSTRDFAADFSVARQFTKINEFIKSADVDIVYIATPHPLHFEQAAACLENNLPVLCEKPLTINKGQSRQLVALSKKHDTFLMEGMWLRFLPSMYRVLDIIGKGTIGKIISVDASMSFKAPYDPDNRFFDPGKGGGSLLDLGVYPVFLAILLLGRPQIIKAIGRLSDTDVDEACSILLGFKEGAYARLESSLLSPSGKPAEITGEKGIIRILPAWFEKSSGIEVEVYGEEKITHPCSWEGHGLQFEVQEVLSCISNKKTESDKMPHSLSLDVIDTMDEIRSQIHVTYDNYE